MSFYEELCYWCDERGTTCCTLASKCGLAKSSASRWKTGSVPRKETQEKMAKFLGISVEQLHNHKVIKAEEGDGTSISIYDKYCNSKFTTVYIPVYSRISSNLSEIFEQYIEGVCPINIEKDENEYDYFFLRIKSDSMIKAGIFVGSKVLIHKQTKPDYNGQIVACKINNSDVTLRRYQENPKYISFFSDNANYEPDVFDKNDKSTRYEILGVVKQVIFDVVH